MPCGAVTSADGNIHKLISHKPKYLNVGSLGRTSTIITVRLLNKGNCHTCQVTAESKPRTVSVCKSTMRSWVSAGMQALDPHDRVVESIEVLPGREGWLNERPTT